MSLSKRIRDLMDEDYRCRYDVDLVYQRLVDQTPDDPPKIATVVRLWTRERSKRRGKSMRLPMERRR